MKRTKLITPMLVLVCILGFYGIAIGGGFDPCPGCCPDMLPPATKGPFLDGTFTVAVDRITYGYGPDYEHYDVHLVLGRNANQHLFSFPVSLGTESLCDYEASSIKTLLAKKPCNWMFGAPFGFDPGKWVPVISDLYIAKKDFCGTAVDEMILGFVTIRLVPLK